MGDKTRAHRVLVGRPEEKRSPGRPTHTWKDNIKMELLEVGWGRMGWIDFAQDRERQQAHANEVMNLQV
jgi:hypothetical protein